MGSLFRVLGLRKFDTTEPRFPVACAPLRVSPDSGLQIPLQCVWTSQHPECPEVIHEKGGVGGGDRHQAFSRRHAAFFMRSEATQEWKVLINCVP